MRKETPVGPIQIESLFDRNRMPREDGKRLLAEADVILAHDVMSEAEFLVFGNDAMSDAAAHDNRQAFRFLRIAIDEGTDELERLLALVMVVKGYYDYEL